MVHVELWQPNLDGATHMNASESKRVVKQIGNWAERQVREVTVIKLRGGIGVHAFFANHTGPSSVIDYRIAKLPRLTYSLPNLTPILPHSPSSIVRLL